MIVSALLSLLLSIAPATLSATPADDLDAFWDGFRMAVILQDAGEITEHFAFPLEVGNGETVQEDAFEGSAVFAWLTSGSRQTDLFIGMDPLQFAEDGDGYTMTLDWYDADSGTTSVIEGAIREVSTGEWKFVRLVIP